MFAFLPTAGISQRIRTYDTGATNPNDPVGFIACGSVLDPRVHYVYVDIYLHGYGVIVDRNEHAVHWNGWPLRDGRLWGEAKDGPHLAFGKTSIATYDQAITGPGQWTFRSFGPGGDDRCTITKR